MDLSSCLLRLLKLNLLAVCCHSCCSCLIHSEVSPPWNLSEMLNLFSVFILCCFKLSLSLKTRASLWDSKGESWKVKVSGGMSCWYLAQLFEAHKSQKTVQGQKKRKRTRILDLLECSLTHIAWSWQSSDGSLFRNVWVTLTGTDLPFGMFVLGLVNWKPLSARVFAICVSIQCLFVWTHPVTSTFTIYKAHF